MLQNYNNKLIHLWLFFDGKAGNDNQVKALIEILKPCFNGESFTLHEYYLQDEKAKTTETPLNFLSHKDYPAMSPYIYFGGAKRGEGLS